MTATTTVTDTARTTQETLAVIRRFEAGFSAPIDVDALMADMTDDCVFDHIAPPEAGFGRHEGSAAVRAVWESLPEHFPDSRLEVEDIFATGNRAAARWIVRWRNPDGSDGMMRGVDIFTLRDGKIAEKLSYATL